MKKVYLKQMGLMILGPFLIALAFNLFLAPHQIVASGLTGLSLIVNYLFAINQGLFVWIVNAILLIIAYFFVGRKYVATAFVGAIIALPLFINVIPVYQAVEDPLLSVIFGGAISGVGTACLFYSNSSAGGTTILGRIIHKYTKLPFSTSVSICDGIIVLSGIFLFGLENTLYGILSIFITRFVAHYLEIGLNKKNFVLIISQEYQLLTNQILASEDFGLTILNGQGGYSKERKDVLLCAVNTSDLKKIRKTVQEIDSSALIIVTNASAIEGHSFQEI